MADDLQFLSLEEVLEIHRSVSGGGSPGDGLRQEGILRACLAMPSTRIGGRYAHQDIFEMAAAYLFHIVHQRPFTSSNQAVGVMSALFFLYLHNLEITADPQSLAGLVRDASSGKTTKTHIANFFRDHSFSTHT